MRSTAFRRGSMYLGDMSVVVSPYATRDQFYVTEGGGLVFVHQLTLNSWLYNKDPHGELDALLDYIDEWVNNA